MVSKEKGGGEGGSVPEKGSVHCVGSVPCLKVASVHVTPELLEV